MRVEILVLAITAFFIADAYNDGKYVAALKKGQKYYKMAGIAFAGLSTFLFLRKNPKEVSSVVSAASGVVRSLPVDARPLEEILQRAAPPQTGTKTVKRSVGETKKKFVASRQGWKCADCKDTLTAWFEVDHKQRLDRGGSNDVENLTALCRNCHGKKTAMESM